MGGHINVVKSLLRDCRVNPDVWMHFPLRIACSGGHLEICKLLVGEKRVTIPYKALSYACEKGRYNVAEWLLSRPEVDPATENNLILCITCSKGHTDVAKLLLATPSVDPAARDSYPFRSACEYGRTSTVALLLEDPRVDPTVLENYGLKQALQNKHWDVAKLLLLDNRVNLTLSQVLLIFMARSYWSEDDENNPFTLIPFELSSKIIYLMQTLFIEELDTTETP